MKRIMTRLISVLLVTVMCFSVFPVEVFAWGKMTHVYTANIIEGLTAEGTGSIAILDGGDSAFEYDIPDEYYEAIMAYPDAFRAGALGPDAYPDIFTGQVYIHPEDDGVEAELEDFEVDPNPERLKVDSGMWVEYLCNAVNKMGKDTEDRKMCLSFTLGCILHYCGDLYGHDFVNTFSGGAFPSFFSTEIFNIKGERLNNILSHLSTESYMDEVVYPNYDVKTDGGIDGPNNFIAGAMVFDGTPAIGLNPIYSGYPATITEKLDEIKAEVSDIWIVGGLLENMVEDLFNEEGNNVPPHYTALLNLRTFLTSAADEYREDMNPVSAGITLFCDRWAEDVDEGIVEFTATCDRIANRIVTGEKNPDLEKKTKEERLEEQNKIWTAFGYDMDEINMWLLITAYRPDADVEQMTKEFNEAGIYGDSFFDLILAELVLMGYITMDMVKTNDSAIMIIKEELSYWMDEYGNYMLFIPDFIIDGIEIPIIGDLLDVVTNLLKAPLYPIFEIIKGMIKDLFAEWVIGICTGTVSDFTGWDEKEVPENLVEIATKIFERIDNPEVQLDHEDNPYKPTENNFADLKEYMDVLASEVKYEVTDSDFEALYNTITMFQLVLMGPENYSKFIKEYAGVAQTSYQMNTGSPEVTSLKVRIKTSDLFLAGTNDNIYMLVYRVKENGSKTQIKCKLLDLAAHDDFEQGDTQTYTVELPESVKLSQLEIGLRKKPAYDLLPGITDDWVCENIRVTPMYAGYELTTPIDLGGVSMAGIVNSLGMNFQQAMKVRENSANKKSQKSQIVTNLKVEIKVADVLYAGSDSDIYLKAVFGSTYWKSVLLDKGEGHNDLERGDIERYNIPITKTATGTAQGIPLDQLYVEFRHYGTDEANWAEVKVTPCYGSLELTTPISLGGAQFQERTWTRNLQTELKKATYREEPTLSQTATSLDIQINVANELGAGTDDEIRLHIFSADSSVQAIQSEVLDKDGYNDFERSDSDVYTVVLSEDVAKIPLNQLRLLFERARNLPKTDADGNPNLIHYEDEANWDEVLVTAYNGSTRLTDPISVGGTEFEDDLWYPNYATNLKLHYEPVAFEYETNLGGGLLAYMDSLDGGEEWVDDRNELWSNTKMRREVFLKIFKGFAPEIEYTGDKTTPEGQALNIALDLTGVWNGVSMERRSQVKDFECVYDVAGNVNIEIIDAAGKSIHKITGIKITDNKVSVEVPYAKKFALGTSYDLKVTYVPDTTNPYYSATEVTITDAIKITGPEYCQVTLKTDGTPDCTVSGGGKHKTGTSVLISASAARGYEFKEWRLNGEVISTTPNFFYTPTEDCTLTAYFETESYSVTLNDGVATVEAKVGDKVNFTAVADGLTGPSYQFYIMYPGKTTWTKSGSSSKINTLIINATAEYNGTRVKAEATDPFGRKATSNEVILTVEEEIMPMKVTKQPSNVNVKLGKSATLTVEVSGGKAPYTYTWQNMGNRWKNILKSSQYSGLDTNTLTFTPNFAGTTEIRCIIEDSAGNEVTTNVALVNAIADPLVLKQPSNANIDLGTSASLTVEASGGTAPYTYSWQVSIGSRWSPISNNAQYSGQGTTTLTVKPSTAGTTEFRCVVKDSAGQEITSTTVTVTAKEVAPLTVKTQPKDAEIDLGNMVALTVAADGGKAPYSYSWQIRTGDSWAIIRDSLLYFGQGTDTLLYMPQSAGTAEIRCLISDSAGNSKLSNTAYIKAKEAVTPLTITNQPSSATTDVGKTISFTVGVSGGKAPYTYTWQLDGGNGWYTFQNSNEYAGQGTNILRYTSNYGSTYRVRCVITDSLGNSVTSNAATATVIAPDPIVIYDQPKDRTEPKGIMLALSLNVRGGAEPLRGQWQGSNDGNNWVNLNNGDPGIEVSDTGFNIYIDTEQVNCHKYMRCVISDAAGQSVTSRVATITIQEKLKVQINDGETEFTISYNRNETKLLTANVTGGEGPYTYKWYVKYRDKWTELATTSSYEANARDVQYNASYYVKVEVKDSTGKTKTSQEVKIKVPDMPVN